MKPKRHDRSFKAFTLVEVLIVVVTLGILAATVVPMFANASADTRLISTISEVKAIHQTATRYNLETGQWPVDGLPGQTPVEFQAMIGTTTFSKGPAIGGEYDWDVGFGAFSVALSIADATTPVAIWTQIDEQLDDGDLTTGWVRRNGTSLQFKLAD